MPTTACGGAVDVVVTTCCGIVVCQRMCGRGCMGWPIRLAGGGGYYLTAPNLGFSTSNAPLEVPRISCGPWRVGVCSCGASPTAVSQPATAAEPPGVFWGEVVFYRSSGNPPQAPPNVTAVADAGGEMVVSWDGFADSEFAGIRSSVIGYVVQWRWFDSGTEHTAQSGRVSPLARSYTIQGLTPWTGPTRCRCVRTAPPTTVSGRPISAVRCQIPDLLRTSSPSSSKPNWTRGPAPGWAGPVTRQFKVVLRLTDVRWCCVG